MKPNSFWQHMMAQSLTNYVAPVPNNKDLHNFAALENAMGCSPVVQAKISELLASSLNSYPDRDAIGLKTKIAKWLNIDTSMITIGNGSDELINLIPQVFIEPGDRCIIQTPTFFRIIEAVHRMKGKLILVATTGQENFALGDDFISKVKKEIKNSQPSIVWLCSPNNPTGELLDVKFIEEIAERTNALVVVDEAYQEICDPVNDHSAVKLINKHTNIIVTKTFSKAFGLAGVRAGFLIANPKIIEAFEKWRLNFPISSISLKITNMALEDIGFLKKVHEHFTNEREFLFSNIDKVPNLKRGGDSKTNIFILRHTKGRLFDLLLKEGILTADFNNMNGLENQGFVRATIKLRPENELLLKALRKVGS